jgi:hypothetical protein
MKIIGVRSRAFAGMARSITAKKCHFLLAFQAKRDILIFDYGCEEAD